MREMLLTPRKKAHEMERALVELQEHVRKLTREVRESVKQDPDDEAMLLTLFMSNVLPIMKTLMKRKKGLEE